ncbi:hypothetical protein [Nonomuraea africana]|uniref:Uncharacterized protein n=1 Tax=Nonomuraea africana TaxID=46171 RepID=A0ABR9KQY4_9ACTN|nr:hypothetical protein [Nonomuraea africana]MBE1564438.1 hypothetical protein [Nonomuraea africana]
MRDDRTALITGLLDLAAFLEANPEVPVSLGTVTVHQFPTHGSDAEMCAQVDKVAAVLGTEIDPKDRPYGHYATGLDFGPVRYQFTAILAAARARRQADDSYRGCVDPA